jgi:uncharacterized protein (TIGR02453 family)
VTLLDDQGEGLEMAVGSGDGFRGWPADALAFYDELAADNTKVWWHANKARYDANVRGPMELLADEVHDEFGPLHIFRAFRDTRFAKDKTPYKTNLGAVTEGEGGASYYLHIAADGLYVGCGYYHMATDQLARYRAAVAEDEPGNALVALVASTERAGLAIGGDSLKTAPRGYPRDHPRVELLRRKGLIAGRQFAPAKWLGTRAALDRITGTWRGSAPLLAWLDTNVGPSELPPEDAW